jgi:hypothetical protein
MLTIGVVALASQAYRVCPSPIGGIMNLGEAIRTIVIEPIDEQADDPHLAADAPPVRAFQQSGVLAAPPRE